MVCYIVFNNMIVNSCLKKHMIVNSKDQVNYNVLYIEWFKFASA